MSLKFSGLLFVLCIFLEARNGLAVSTKSIIEKQTQDVVTPTDTMATTKPQNISKENDGPVVVPNPQVTITLPSAAEIFQKSTVEPPVPNPTTPAPPTTPTPFPAPELGKWTVRNNDTKKTCIIAQMMMQLNVTYPGNDGKTQNTLINVPGKNSNVTGNCTSTPQSMIISWGPNHSLEINFGMDKTAKQFYISGLSLNVNASVFKNVKEKTMMIKYGNHSREFMTPLNMSYKCSKAQNVSLTSEDPELKAVLSLSDMQFEAYMNKTKGEFGAAQDCDAFDTPDIVPIAVGCALAILVLVVLVAYLIGRKSSQNRGYLSM